MKIWIVFSGEYEDRTVDAVFSSEDLAVAHIEASITDDMAEGWGEKYEYRDFEVDSEDVDPTEKRIFSVCTNQRTNHKLEVEQTREIDDYDHFVAKDKYFGDESFYCEVIAENNKKALDYALDRIDRIEFELVDEYGENWRDIKGY